MNEKRLEFLLACYGASPERWPPTERAAAQSLLAATPKLREVADAARGLDEYLEAGPVSSRNIEIQARLAAAILARAKTVKQERPPAPIPLRDKGIAWLGWLRPLWPNLVGLAASAALGLFVGWMDIDALADVLTDEVVGEVTIEEDSSW
ncbi:MAG: hypothetical protein EXQ89_03210 [Rhodospirillaceae bacterium]|nr:hypothetical protein [Rhodospirillaceae bacterium]